MIPTVSFLEELGNACFRANAAFLMTSSQILPTCANAGLPPQNAGLMVSVLLWVTSSEVISLGPLHNNGHLTTPDRISQNRLHTESRRDLKNAWVCGLPLPGWVHVCACAHTLHPGSPVTWRTNPLLLKSSSVQHCCSQDL